MRINKGNTNGHKKGGILVDDFLSNNVNAFSGDVLLCDSYVVRMFPDLVLAAANGRSSFSYAPELSHVDQLGFKISTIFRLGRLSSLHVLIKDGSPHSAQMPSVVQEAAANSIFPFDKIRFFVVEKGSQYEISHEGVRAARHLSEIEALMRSSVHRELGRQVGTPRPPAGSVAILVGGRSDLVRVRQSEMLGILDTLSISYELSVISSEQNPEELRKYCSELKRRDAKVVICIAGLVPGLPAAVKAQLPFMPVLSVPLSVPGFSASDIMLASFSVPARRPVILSGMDEVGLKKAVYLACEIMSVGDQELRKRYAEYIKCATPAADFGVAIADDSVHDSDHRLKAQPGNGNGRRV